MRVEGIKGLKKVIIHLIFILNVQGFRCHSLLVLLAVQTQSVTLLVFCSCDSPINLPIVANNQKFHTFTENSSQNKVDMQGPFGYDRV